MAFDVTFTLQDAYARRTTRRFTSNKALLADVVTAVATMVTRLEAVSLCAVVKTEISEPTVYASSAQAGANVDAGGTLHGRLNNGKLYPLHIPAIDPNLVNTDGSIKLSEAAITNFADQFSGLGAWYVSEGNTVDAIESGELDR